MTDSYLYLLVRSLLTLVLVLGLMGILLYALKYFMRASKGGKNGAFKPMKVLSTSFMGQKKNVAIVDVAGEILVLGITQSSITLLTKIEEPQAKEELRKMNGAGTRPFLNIFH